MNTQTVFLFFFNWSQNWLKFVKKRAFWKNIKWAKKLRIFMDFSQKQFRLLLGWQLCNYIGKTLEFFNFLTSSGIKKKKASDQVKISINFWAIFKPCSIMPNFSYSDLSSMEKTQLLKLSHKNSSPTCNFPSLQFNQTPIFSNSITWHFSTPCIHITFKLHNSLGSLFPHHVVSPRHQYIEHFAWL